MNATRLMMIMAGTAALAFAAPAAAQDDWSWNGTVPAGRTLEIKGINGPIRAVAASGSQVRVTVDKTARRSNIDEVRLEVVEHGGGVTICAVYPTPPRSRRPNECGPGKGGHMSVNDNDVNVSWTVHVPRGVHLTASTINGDVEATGLTGDLLASTINGAIDASTTGFARASTVNGSIDVSMGRNSGNRGMAFSTVNGSINAAFASDVNADIDASTVTGSIDADFPIKVSGRWGPKNATARLGSGGPSMKLSTVNGSIQLTRR